MKKYLKIFSLTLLLFIIPMVHAGTPFSADAEMIESFVGGDDTFFLSTTTRRGGQVFTVGVTGNDTDFELEGFSLLLYRVGTPGLVSISLYNVSAGIPDTLIVQNITFDADTELGVGAGGDWVNITMPPTFLLDTVNYSLVVEFTTAGTVNYRANSGGGYGGGSLVDDTGAGFIEKNDDLIFMVWGVNKTLPTVTTTLITPANVDIFPDSTLDASAEIFSTTSAGELVNSTLFVWDNVGGLLGQVTTSITGFTNISNITFSPVEELANVTWNVRACAENATAANCGWANLNRTVTQNFFILGQCNVSSGEAYINFTFKNETVAQEDTTASVVTSFWSYWVDLPHVNRTLAYINGTENDNYAFCSTPAETTLNTDVSFSYDNSESEQRNYNPNTLSLTNSSLNVTLFLLPTSEGIFVTFQVINQAEQPIGGALVELSRSGFGVVAQQLTGSSGTASIFLNPNLQYTLVVSKSGFSSFETTQTFPTTEFTVILGQIDLTASIDYLKGTLFKVRPKVQILNNHTDYLFNFTIRSDFWSLEEWGFRLINETGVMNTSLNTTPETGGIAGAWINTGTSRLIEMQYFWKINGSYVNGSALWGVDVPGEGSLKGFFDRLSTYLDDGMFGVSNFGVAIIIFLIMFTTIGILSFKFGLNSPEAIMLIAFFVVALFDIGFGLVPSPFEKSITGAPTFIALIILIAVWLGRNQ